MIRSLLIAAMLSLPATSALADDRNDVRFMVGSKTVLEGDQEVPPVVSNGFANGIIQVESNRRRAEFKFTFSNLDGAFTRLHLHCNVAGQNGPIALGLIDLVAVANDNSEFATLDSNRVVATIRNRDFPADGGPCGIYSVRDLVDEINNGGIYYNLHTTAVPSGELRGQVERLEPVRRRLRNDD